MMRGREFYGGARRPAWLFIIFCLFGLLLLPGARAQQDGNMGLPPPPPPLKPKPKPTPTPRIEDQEIGEGDVISVSTTEVLLPVTVRDGAGRLVTDLQREDFRIFEDGREQPLTDIVLRKVPVDVVLMVDASRDSPSASRLKTASASSSSTTAWSCCRIGRRAACSCAARCAA
jgi:hypothetical protein